MKINYEITSTSQLDTIDKAIGVIARLGCITDKDTVKITDGTYTYIIKDQRECK